MVGPGGLEPLTSSVSRKRSNQLSYGPVRKVDLHSNLRPSQAANLYALAQMRVPVRMGARAPVCGQ